MDSDKDLVGQNEGIQPVTEAAEAAPAEPGATPEPRREARGRGRAREASTADLEALQPGTPFTGKVKNVVEFGAFVDIGVGRDGLVHVSLLKRANMDKTVKVGDSLDVLVRHVDLENGRISLTLPSLEKGNKAGLRDLQVGAVVTGRVVRLAEFGAFVDIGAQTDGLLHISQMSGGFVNHPGEVVKVGDEVQVRITEVDAKKRRISLSMKEAKEEQERVVVAQPKQEESGERMPTAFEMAFEEARQKARRKQARART